MTSDTISDNPAISPASPEGKRHVFGPRHLAAVLPGVLRPVYKRRSPTTTQLLLDWESIVGPELARATVPKKLFSGTLVIVCAGPVALELQHLADVVISRINTHLGRTAVTRLRFVQDLAPQAVPPRARPRPATAAAATAVSALPPGDLRDALERLGRAVLTERG